MQIHKKRFLFFTALIFLCRVGISQSVEKKKSGNEYQVVNWNYSSGLLYGRTTCFLKDFYGFLWVGTQNGLNRFDGNHFINYLKNQVETKTVLDNHILSLVEDSLHNIWIGTEKGLTRYDIKADSFASFFSQTRGVGNDQMVVPIWCTRDKIFCIESDSLFTSYDVQTMGKKNWAALPRKILYRDALSQSVYEPKTNSIWLLPAAGSLFANGGIFCFSLTNGKLELFDWSCFLHNSGHDHWTEGMCYDRKRNALWLNTPDGLIKFSLDERRFDFVKTLEKINGRGIGIQVDQQNRIWVGTNHDGIGIYDPEKKTYDKILQQDSIQQKLVNFQNYRIYCDLHGVVWIGYWPEYPKGIFQLIPISKSVTQYPPETGKLNALSSSYGFQLSRAENKIWVFAAPGLNIFDPSAGTFELIESKDLKGIPPNEEASFMNAGRSPGKFLITLNQDGGLFEASVKDKICTAIPVKDEHDNIIPKIQFDEGPVYNYGQLIWLTGESGHRIFLLRKDSPVAHTIFYFPDRQVRSISTDGENYLFVRFTKTNNSSTYQFHQGKWIMVATSLDSISWNKIVYDSIDRTWWAGGYGQIYHFSKNFHLIRRYGFEEGVPIINVWAIKPDDQGNIWLNTEVSIAKLTVSTGRITILSDMDGSFHEGFKLIPDDIANDLSGDLYFFGYHGLTRINPHTITSTYPPSLIYFKSLDVNQANFSLSTGINNVKNLVLSYAENNISVETGVIDFYSRGKSHIRYRLGKFSSWQYGSAQFTIHYEGLQPGKYQLFIQASNNANEFNGPEKILDINIQYPWWKMWWAYSAFAVLLIFSILFIVWYRLKTLKARNTLLEQKIELRTKELHLSLVELKDTQTQLIQREKMASLGELTAGIAHEIQNPLNFVNNFSEVSTELVGELREEEISPNRNIEMVQQLLDSIDQNLQKITHHGKRADAIVKGMLQHSRISTGKKEPTDINSLIEEYIHLAYNGLRFRIPNFQSEIYKELDGTVGKINISPQEIGRVLLNLLNNAFYAVNEKRILLGETYKPGVLISTQRWNQSKKGSDFIEIHVRDNGMGIDPDIMNKIYQPFFTTKPTGEGTGLGLSLSYDIVTKVYGGELTMHTEPGEYAEFIITVPF
jgi:signal transduction histidine kinase